VHLWKEFPFLAPKQGCIVQYACMRHSRTPGSGPCPQAAFGAAPCRILRRKLTRGSADRSLPEGRIAHLAGIRGSRAHSWSVRSRRRTRRIYYSLTPRFCSNCKLTSSNLRSCTGRFTLLHDLTYTQYTACKGMPSADPTLVACACLPA
jgi:hypothetical protein